MLVPRTSQRFFDPFDFSLFPSTEPKATTSLMKTDIKETDKGYELHVDLPGFKKEDIQAEIKDGYLTVTAETHAENEEKNGTYLRKERFAGKCSVTSTSARRLPKTTSPLCLKMAF